MFKDKEINALILTSVVYFIVFAIKLFAYFQTGVMVVLAEALHTLSDLFVSGFLLITTIYAIKKADNMHMFGHNRAQNIGALVAATLFISFTSLRLFEEAIPKLITHHESVYQNLPIALWILVISMIIVAIPLFKFLFQKNKGATGKAQYLELINDELGLAAALIGTIFVSIGQPIADPIASIVVATIIAVNGIKLFSENFSLLIGRAPEPKLLRKIEKIALSVRNVRRVNSIKAEYLGVNEMHIDLELEIKRTLTLEKAHEIAEEVEKRICKSINCGNCMIHVNPEGK